ncbi:MAG: hypothetical protein J6S58_08025 [Lentisphaeria bacterium]|nr:hypothetical protein [Lentisphaeria bacterium]
MAGDEIAVNPQKRRKALFFLQEFTGKIFPEKNKKKFFKEKYLQKKEKAV